MLMALAGKTHQVHTAVSIATVSGQTKDCVVVSSDVQFADLSQEWIADYIATGGRLWHSGNCRQHDSENLWKLHWHHGAAALRDAGTNSESIR